MLDSCPDIYTIEELGRLVTDKLRSSIPLDHLKPILQSYVGDDWKHHCCFSSEKYQRNRIYINDQIEILLICWDINQKSCVHDHPENGCLVRLMEGELREDCYKLSDENKLVLVSSYDIPIGGISFKKGTTGLHSIINPSDKRSCSLHIYSPPQYVPRFYKI
jgi:predicted metal-dependent enzyme (double-stranded beta helix superfamily)